MPENPIFTKWLKEHSLTPEKFLSVVEGRCAPLPFFPVLPADQQLVARLAYFLPPRYTGRGGGAEAGVLRYVFFSRLPKIYVVKGCSSGTLLCPDRTFLINYIEH
jgi:hypothetical protein